MCNSYSSAQKKRCTFVDADSQRYDITAYRPKPAWRDMFC